MATAKTERKRLITPIGRFTYPNLFKPRVNPKNPAGKPKYSCGLLVRVADTPESKAAGEKSVGESAEWKAIQDEVKRIFAEALGPTWAERIKDKKSDGSPMFRIPFRRGDAAEFKTPDGKGYKDGYGPGIIVISANSDYAPGVIDRDKSIIVNPNDVQGGYYGRLQIHAYFYNNSGNQGVTFGLDNVQKDRDGVPFGNRANAADAFDAIEPPTGPVPAGAAQGAASTGDPFGGAMG